MVEAGVAQFVQLALEHAGRGEVELADRDDADDVSLRMHVDGETAGCSVRGGMPRWRARYLFRRRGLNDQPRDAPSAPAPMRIG